LPAASNKYGAGLKASHWKMFGKRNHIARVRRGSISIPDGGHLLARFAFATSLAASHLFRDASRPNSIATLVSSSIIVTSETDALWAQKSTLQNERLEAMTNQEWQASA